jgi:hypothetical protein
VDDPERILGVIEAITAARDQCPNAAVRSQASNALEAIRAGGRDALPEQAFLVFSTTSGWRGARATQVRRSLQAFLAEASGGTPS